MRMRGKGCQRHGRTNCMECKAHLVKPIRPRIVVSWSRDNTCYARIYDATGLLVAKISGYTRVIDCRNAAITEFEDLFPGQLTGKISTPHRREAL